MMRILPLRNLAPDESRAYLELRGVPTDQIDAVMDFTHGHALALSLVADVYDQGANTGFRPESAPNRLCWSNWFSKYPARFIVRHWRPLLSSG
jgi:hypothetical protein